MRSSRLGVLALAVGFPQLALAGEFKFGFEDLVNQEILVPRPRGLTLDVATDRVEASAGGCSLKADWGGGNSVVIEPGPMCDAIFRQSNPPAGQKISVKFIRNEVTVGTTSGEFDLKSTGAPATLAPRQGGDWVQTVPKDGKFYYFDADSRRWHMAANVKTAGDLEAAGTSVYHWKQGESKYREVEAKKEFEPAHVPQVDFKCPAPDEPLNLKKKSDIVCATIDDDGDISIKSHVPHVIGPNRRVVVVVRRRRGTRVRVSMGGTPGLFAPGLHQGSPKASPARRVEENGLIVDPDQTWVESTQSFAPRQPGAADISVKVLDANGNTHSESKFELIVDKSYVGALRVGFGVVFSNALDASYRAAKRPGSEQYEVVAQHGGNTDFELIVGFAPFAFDFIRGGKGRRYIGQPLRKRALGLAPFVGTGMLAVDKQGAEFLKSLHLGLEWEPVPHFSFAVTAVGRRVDRLQGGLRVGSAVSEGEVPTRTGVLWGVGFVVNVTPEFFRFANQSSELLGGGTNR